MYPTRSSGLMFLLSWIIELIFVIWVIGFVLFIIRSPAAAAEMTAHVVVKAGEWLMLTIRLITEQWRTFR